MPSPQPKAASQTRTVSVRWTPRLAELGWTPIADFFLDNYHRLEPRLKYSEAMFIIHLMRHKWDGEAPFPSIGTVAQKMGISVQAARALARSLERKRLLVREGVIGGTNKFHLGKLFRALEHLSQKDEKGGEQRTSAEPSQPRVWNPFNQRSKVKGAPSSAIEAKRRAKASKTRK